MCIFSCSSQEKACEIAEVISVPQNFRIFQITKEKVYILNLSWNYQLKKARKPLQWLQKELRGRRQFHWELACQSHGCSLGDPETQVWHRPPSSQRHCLSWKPWMPRTWLCLHQRYSRRPNGCWYSFSRVWTSCWRKHICHGNRPKLWEVSFWVNVTPRSTIYSSIITPGMHAWV